MVSFDVPLDFGDPVVGVVPTRELREPMLQVASVPEVTVTEHHCVFRAIVITNSDRS
jgi:hypothetical protein